MSLITTTADRPNDDHTTTAQGQGRLAGVGATKVPGEATTPFCDWAHYDALPFSAAFSQLDTTPLAVACRLPMLRKTSERARSPLAAMANSPLGADRQFQPRKPRPDIAVVETKEASSCRVEHYNLRLSIFILFILF